MNGLKPVNSQSEHKHMYHGGSQPLMYALLRI